MKRTTFFLVMLALPLACGGGEPVGDGVPPTWPGFGGPAGNFRVEASGLSDRWPVDGPVERWSHPLGA